MADDNRVDISVGAQIGDAQDAIAQVRASLNGLGSQVNQLSGTTKEAAVADSEWAEIQRNLAAAHKEFVAQAQVKADALLKLKTHTADVVARVQEQIAAETAAKNSTAGAGGAMVQLGLNTQYARRELMTLTRELLTGNFGRVPISFGSLVSHSNLLAAALSPQGLLALGIAAIGGAMGYMAVKTEEADRTFAKLNAKMIGSGTGDLFSSLGLKDLEEQLQSLPGMTRDSTDATLSAMAGFHRLGADMFRDVTITAVDFAAAIGEKTPAAAKKLAEAISDPAKGARKLHDELGILTAQQILHIEQLDRQGNRYEAQKFLLALVQDRVQGLANEGMTPLQTATNDLGAAWDKLTKSGGDKSNGVVGALVAVLDTATSLIDKLNSSESKKALTSLMSYVSFGPMFGGAANAILQGLVAGGEGEGEGASPGGKGGGVPATGGAKQSETKKFITDQVLLAQAMRGPAGEIQKMQDQLVGLKRARFAAFEGGDTGDVKQLDAAIANLNERIAQAQKNLPGMAEARKQAAEQKKLHEQDRKDLLKGIEAQTKEYEDGLREQGKLVDQANKEKKKLEEEDRKGLLKGIERQTKEYEDGLRAQAKADDEARAAKKKVWADFMAPINSAINTSIRGIIMGTTTIRDAFRHLAQSIVLSFAEAGLNILTDWIATQLGLTTATTAGVAARATAEKAGAVQSVMLWAGAALKNIMTSAWEAMAGAYKAMAGIPFVGPVLAPVVAAGAFAAVAGMAKNVISAAGGYDIPAGVNPLVQAHAEEMVLPKQQANAIRDMAKGGGGGAPMNITIHAVDAASIRKLFMDHGPALSDAIRRQARNFTPTVAK